MLTSTFARSIFANLVSSAIWAFVIAVAGAVVSWQSFGWTWWLVTFPVGVLVGFAVVLVPAWLAIRREAKQGLPVDEPMRVLAWYYMRLTLLKEHVQDMISMEELSDKPLNYDYYQPSSWLDKMRRELINLSPTVFPTSTAIEFQPPHGRLIDAKARVSHEVNELMKKVLRQWHRYYDETQARDRSK